MFTFELPYKVKMIKKIMNFSIVILTKNDQENLPKLLNSLTKFKEHNGEVCIIDVGSTDNTIQIATDWGCKIDYGSQYLMNIDDDMANIMNEKFHNNLIFNTDKYFDYSGIKNYATSIVSNDMILILYANMNLVEFDIEKIQECIDGGFDLLNFETNHNIKLYNRKKYNWENIICENLIKIIDDETKELTTSYINISPFDDKLFTENNREKLVALSMTCFLNSSDKNINKLFLNELLNENFNSAQIELDRQLTTCDDIDKCKLLVDFGDFLLNNGNDGLALEYYYKAYLNCSKLRLPLYKIGQYYFSKQIWDRCIFYLEGCLNIPKHETIEDDDIMYKDGPHSMLYVAWWWNGNIKKGKYYFDKAIEINPFNTIYIDESIFHYEYKGNIIDGPESFQQLQFLYSEAKKHKSILEVYPNARSTEALLSGSNDIVSVIRQSECNCFIRALDDPGNLKIIYTSIEDTIKYFENENIKFDMVVLHNYNEIIHNYNEYWGIRIWEKFTNKILCGFDYIENKKLIDDTFEISGVKENIWYKNISSFEKTIIYKKKN